MRHSVSVTCRERILEVAGELARRTPQGTFSVQEVVEEMQARGLPYAKNTIYVCMAVVMCTGAPRCRKLQFNDLERVEKGVYRLAEAQRQVEALPPRC